MSLNLTALDAVINDYYQPEVADNVFAKNNGLMARLYKESKEYNERDIVVPIEYDDISNTAFLDELESIELSKKDFLTAASFSPKFFGASLLITKQQELLSTSPSAVKSYVKTAMKNLTKGMIRSFNDAMWARPNSSTGALPNSKYWNSVPFLIHDHASYSVGNISPSDFADWKSVVLGNSDFSDDTTSETDLTDPTSDVYILKLFQRGIAKTSYQAAGAGTGAGIICVCPQYLWDLTEDLLDPQKTGSALDEEMGQMGFRALRYRNMRIIPDNEMVNKQTGDSDGEMFFINENYLDMWFHPNAKMESEPFQRGTNVYAASKLFFGYGNISISNRRAQMKIQDLRSPKDWIQLGDVNTMGY